MRTSKRPFFNLVLVESFRRVSEHEHEHEQEHAAVVIDGDADEELDGAADSGGDADADADADQGSDADSDGDTGPVETTLHVTSPADGDVVAGGSVSVSLSWNAAPDNAGLRLTVDQYTLDERDLASPDGSVEVEVDLSRFEGQSRPLRVTAEVLDDGEVVATASIALFVQSHYFGADPRIVL